METSGSHRQFASSLATHSDLEIDFLGIVATFAAELACGSATDTPTTSTTDDQPPLLTDTPTTPAPSGVAMSRWSLVKHNQFRCSHCDTPDLKWNTTLASQAATCAATCPTGHTCDTHGAGENLYWKGFTTSMVENQASWDEAVQSWYDESPDWNYATSFGNGGVVGHFTQVIWRSSLQLGCAMNTNC